MQLASGESQNNFRISLSKRENRSAVTIFLFLQAAKGADGADAMRRQRYFCVSGERKPVQMDWHHQRATGHSLRGTQVQVVARFPQLLPVRPSRGEVHDALFPPQRGPVWSHLPRHLERQMDGTLRRPHHPAVDPKPTCRA